MALKQLKIKCSPELHAAIKKAAEEENSSMCQYVLVALAGIVGPIKKKPRIANTSTEGFSELFEVKECP